MGWAQEPTLTLITTEIRLGTLPRVQPTHTWTRTVITRTREISLTQRPTITWRRKAPRLSTAGLSVRSRLPSQDLRSSVTARAARLLRHPCLCNQRHALWPATCLHGIV